MRRLIFDIETDGLDATRVHSLVVKDADTGQVWSCTDQVGQGFDYSINTGLVILEQADVLIGHNIIKYDLPTIRRLYPDWRPKGLVRDTLTISRLIWTDMENEDFRRRDRGVEFPATMIGDHSLKSWGYRLGVLKGIFHETADWSKWTPEMQRYCEQDVEVSHALWTLIEKQQYSEEAAQLEHDFQEVIFLQETHGFRFNEQAAGALASTLLFRKQQIVAELQALVPPAVEEMKTPEYWTASNEFGEAARAETKGGLAETLKERGIKARTVQIKPGPNRKRVTPFNPGSRQQVAAYLQSQGWTPVTFTPTGQPEVNESILERLAIKGATELCEFFVIHKLLGQLSEGDNAWLKLARKGRIHGAVICNGAITGRCTHFKPNVSQVPAVMKNKAGETLHNYEGRWGWECRSLFMADEGQVLVGADASGLELRCLAHYMARYDDGDYAKVVLEGDVHSVNQKAAGIATRAEAKTFIYSYLYGAGNHKLGVNCGGVKPEEIGQFKAHKDLWASELRMFARKREREGTKFTELDVALSVKGAIIRKQFETQTPALAKLKEALGLACKRGYLIGLDGRKLHVRSRHAALNTLLQSAGALLVKKATVLLYQRLKALGYTFGKDFANVVHVHDEMQLSVRPDLAETVGTLAVQSIKEAGEHFRFRCRLDGEFKIGPTWSSTH